MTINQSISNLLAHQVLNNKCEFGKSKEEIIKALHILLNGDFIKYSFEDNIISDEFAKELSSDNFQGVLSKINERQSRRKKDGVYYTPKDVTRYLILNSFVNYINRENNKVLSDSNCLKYIHTLQDQQRSTLLGSTVFDPTAGAGEFLVSALELKFEILESIVPEVSDDMCIAIVSTIFGNDIAVESIEISKIRLFFTMLPKIKEGSNLIQIARILNQNFSVADFVVMDRNNFGSYDIIIGNPPYVEYRKLDKTPLYNYGNIYADVLHNSSLLLNDGGVMGFVIPISYVSTTRMKKIRNQLNLRVPKQFVLNYADRPDCLFPSVHQKLSLFIGCNTNQDVEIHTSGYNYWYKAERKELLNGCKLAVMSYSNDDFIPKIGNDLEQSIFSKIVQGGEYSIMDMQSNEVNHTSSLFLNMRGCFWMKAFSFSPGSSEYKEFKFDKEIMPYILCLLNSSLFFMFWIIVSDCWHITSKELKLFKVATNNLDTKKFSKLAKQLESQLENTKEYIGTKQTEYAYKHKECKAEIDNIDSALQEIYNLTTEELNYIKQFSLKYRMGGNS